MNIIFTHCSALIIIANCKLKMSRSYRSYDEDWQRRKSVLIRSLFHDIPILSPVEEESNDSSQDYRAPSPQPFPSPPRPYSPLPPLIIERVPITNKHDEPEEYYTKLHKKIIKIYVKLFIENRNSSSINSDDSSVNNDDQVRSDDSDSVRNPDLRFLESISPENGDFDSIIEDRKARESSASTKSNGYGADFESMDTAIIDVVNHTTSTEDAANITVLVEESDTESFDRDAIGNKDSDNCRSSENIKSSKETTDNRVSDEELISTNDDQAMTEIEKSKETDVVHSYAEEEFSNESIDEHEITEETNKSGDSDTVIIDDLKTGDELHNSTINDQEMTDSKNSSEPENEQQTETDSGTHDSETKSKGGEKTASEEGNGNVETSSTGEDSDYRQITTIALVHFDGSKDAEDRESRVYEDSVKSVILPRTFRRVVARSVDDELKVFAELEEKDDPRTGSTFDTEESVSTEEDLEEVKPLSDAITENILAMRTSTPEASEEEFEERRTSLLDTPEEDLKVIRTHQPDTNEDRHEEEDDVEMESPDSIEQMRTPRPDSSRGTMPVTHQSDSESACEHTALHQEATMMTSSSQDGAEQNVSNLQTSNDMNGILTSIFNESESKNGTPASAKKRKLADKSVQAAPTMRVTWEEMRANFFVGTPKIFRLCACTDHICL